MTLADANACKIAVTFRLYWLQMSVSVNRPVPGGDCFRRGAVFLSGIGGILHWPDALLRGKPIVGSDVSQRLVFVLEADAGNLQPVQALVEIDV